MRIVTFTPKSSPSSSPRARRAAARRRARAELRRRRRRLGGRPAARLVRSRRRVAAEGAADPRPARRQHGACRDAAARVGAGAGAISRLGPPVPRPGKLICIGLNYKDHAAESNMPVPKSPVTFSKYVDLGHRPEHSRSCCRRRRRRWTTRRSSPSSSAAAPSTSRSSKAWDYVLGYMNLNDVSARDLQFADGQWQRGKSCDTFAPMGPAIVTARRRRQSARAADPPAAERHDAAGLVDRPADLRHRPHRVVPVADRDARAGRRDRHRHAARRRLRAEAAGVSQAWRRRGSRGRGPRRAVQSRGGRSSV